MITPVALPKFLAGWLPALAVATVVPEPKIGDLGIIVIAGMPIPMVTVALGFLGIIMARPLARRGEAELSWAMFALVSGIMLILVELWIVESRPGWLFAFVVAIGLGFSGYSIIELMGEQVQTFIREIFTRAKSTIGQRPGAGPNDGDSL